MSKTRKDRSDIEVGNLEKKHKLQPGTVRNPDSTDARSDKALAHSSGTMVNKRWQGCYRANRRIPTKEKLVKPNWLIFPMANETGSLVECLVALGLNEFERICEIRTVTINFRTCWGIEKG